MLLDDKGREYALVPDWIYTGVSNVIIDPIYGDAEYSEYFVDTFS